MRRLVLTVSLFLLGSGCTDPIGQDSDPVLQRHLVESMRRQVQAIPTDTSLVVKRPASDLYLEQDPKRIQQLDETYGPGALLGRLESLGTGLDGEESTTTKLSLHQAILSHLRNNLNVRLARLQPAISEAQLAAAEAVFDATLFSDFSYTWTDRPQPATAIGGVVVGTPLRRSTASSVNLGLRKPLQSGALLTVSSGLSRDNNQTPGVDLVPNPSWTSDILLGVSQPLLRDFGAAATRAQISLSRNAHRREVLNLKAALLTSVGQVESAYWRLRMARHQLAIQELLLQMTLETRQTLEKRQKLDVGPIQLAQAYSFVERSRAQVVRARQNLRDTSDELKGLMDDPALPVGDETVLVPVDEPVEAELAYSYLDEVLTAQRRRPEMLHALLEIDDASIRQAVADNQRLPQLNLNAQIQYFGMDQKVSSSLDRMEEGRFIEYLLGAQFEVPIGNRAAEADYRRSRLQRQGAILNYQAALKTVHLEVKTSLRQIQAMWELISVNRSARRAAAENLRAIQDRERLQEALTPDFLDLKLNAQQRLVDAQLQELQALLDYNIAIVRLRQVTGSLLDHNQIQMDWPENMFD